LVGNITGGAVPDLLFDAAGNLFGVRGGGLSPNFLMSIDKTTAAATDIGGPIGFVSVSGLTSGQPSSQPHAFSLLADNDITLSRFSELEGDIHANNDVEFDDGKSGESKHTGDVTAVDDVRIDEDNTINGDVTAGDNVDNNGTVNGMITENAAVQEVPLPVLSFAAGGEDIDVDDDETLDLPPGSYGEVEVDDEATLNLTSGDYFFECLELDDDSILEIDVTNGPVTINVVDHLDIEKDVEFIIIPGGESATDQVTINVKDDKSIKVDRGSKILGTLVAPDAKVTLEDDVSFKGSICARNIEVESATVLSHTSTTALPKRIIAQGPVAETSATVIPTEFALEQNYPNPFNPSTTIPFSVTEASEVSLKIYNLNGQLVRTLHSGAIAAGEHQRVWDGTDFRGVKVASGVYIYQLKAKGFVATKKLVLTK